MIIDKIPHSIILSSESQITIEDMFFLVCQYLMHTSNDCIFQSPEKVNCCQRELEFVGFLLGEDSIKASLETGLGEDSINPSLQILIYRPVNIMDIHSFICLLEPVALAFSKTTVMQPFRDLLSPKSELHIYNTPLRKP